LQPSLDDLIGFSTAQMGRNLIRYLSFYLKPYDVTPEQWTVLKKLTEMDGISQKELAHKAKKDQATLTRILDILERKELIRKQMNKEDRRSFSIYSTDKGEALKQVLHPFIEGLFEKILWNIPVEKLEAYKQVMSLLNENIELEMKNKE
jgi:MarR family transcriptional regulator, transcriptional regulator for hemolysin